MIYQSKSKSFVYFALYIIQVYFNKAQFQSKSKSFVYFALYIIQVYFNKAQFVE